MATLPNPLSLDGWQVCEDFRQAWDRGERPELATYLNRYRVPAARTDLFWNLFEVEVEYRRQRGETPRVEDYQAFAVEFRDVLTHVLSVPSGPPRQKPSSPAAIPPELCNSPDYVLLRELGRGGMGVVYLAKNRLLDRPEALKVINQSRLAQEGVIERFLREIRLAARLNHPNIVTAYSAARLGDLLVFAMEYVEGEDLANVVGAAGPLSVPNACAYVLQAASGLQHAHERGLVHRDIKPANLILSHPDGEPRVKILDFGLAKANQEQVAETRFTGTGIILGTPDYLAPELVQEAAGADVRADIYSLGCTLYFLLSGAPPFQDKSLFGILRAHVSERATPLNEVRPNVPAELAAVAARMMAKEPAGRYQVPAEVVRALTPFVKAGHTAVPAETTFPGKPTERRGDVPAGDGRAIHPGNVQGRPAQRPLARTRKTEGGAASTDSHTKPGHGSSTAAVLPRPGQKGRRVRKTESQHRRPGARPVFWLLAVVGVGILALGSVALIVAFGSGIPRGSDSTKGTEKPEHPAVRREPKPGAVWTNQLGMKFVFVPAGSFWMGGGGGTPGDRQVTIPDDFYLGMHAVTQAEWRLLMADVNPSPSYFSRPGPGWQGFGWQAVSAISDADLDRLPVEQVSWDDVQEFLARLNKREPNSDWVYQLPRETEWEYACRGAASSKEDCSFHFYFQEPTNDLSSDKANFKGTLPVGNGKSGAYLGRTTTAGSFGPNRLGLFDMHGNIWQWCHDEQGTGHVYRGGSWAAPGFECRASNRRIPPTPSHRHCVIGFRIARISTR